MKLRDFHLFVIGFATLVVAGCGSSASKLSPTPQCALDSDCPNATLRCIQLYCVKACNVSSDCPESERCIEVTIGGPDGGTDGGTTTGNSCQPFEKATCTYNSDCTDPLVCSADQQCRNQCQADKDCLTGQKCTSITHLCADPSIDKNYNSATNEFNTTDAGSSDAPATATDGRSDTPQSTGNDGPMSGNDASSGPDTGPVDVPPACSPGLAGFHPSNLPSPVVQPSDITDYVQTVDGTFDTDALTFTPAAGALPPDGGTDGGASGWSAVVVKLSDNPREAAVAFFKSYSLATGKTLSITGLRPLIIAADGTISVDGTIVGVPSPLNNWYGGGPPGPPGVSRGGLCALDNANGGGEPGGLAYTDGIGAGGGAYCGKGGNGSVPPPMNDAGVTPSSGGVPYGTPELVPLAGGSSGGTEDSISPGNHGGGALELVSGTAVVIDTNAIINLGGGAQNSNTSRALGGGSGGAILLEAPSVTVRGILAVNGGGGSDAYSLGEAGLASLQPAVGGNNSGGGNGSDGTNIDGEDGKLASNNFSGGGGGGAGRIRMNSGCGGGLFINSGAIISPTRNTTCVTSGSLQ